MENLEIVTIEGIDFDNYLGVDYNEKREKAFLRTFYNRLETGEAYEQDFNRADGDGNLSFNQMGYTIFMSNKEIMGTKYDSYYKASHCRAYSVVVIAIDEKEKRIEVSHARAKLGEKERLQKILDDLISQGKKCSVPVKIERVYPNIAIGDIGGLGIPCLIRIKEWSVAFTSDMTACVKKGDIVQVAALNKKSATAERNKYFSGIKQRPYVCSRKMQMENDGIDPWKNIEERFKKGDVVNLTCNAKEDSHFFGKMDGLNEINVYGLYPQDEKFKKADIVPGLRYQCVVRSVSEENKILRVKPFRCLDDLDAVRRKIKLEEES